MKHFTRTFSFQPPPPPPPPPPQKKKPCDNFLLSIIVARNYVLACIYCIVWYQQISIWNKQIESSIYLIKQVGKHAQIQKSFFRGGPKSITFFFLLLFGEGGRIQIPLYFCNFQGGPYPPPPSGSAQGKIFKI